MDPFTNLGAAAAVIQFTDFGTRFGRNMLDMYRPHAKLEGEAFFRRTAQELKQAVTLLEEKSKRVAGEGGSAFGPNQEVPNPGTDSRSHANLMFLIR